MSGLLAHAKRSYPELTEDELDRLVNEIGGTREGVSEFRHLPINLWRKRRNRTLKTSNPVYLIPRPD